MLTKYKLLFVIFPGLISSNFNNLSYIILAILFRFSFLLPLPELCNVEFSCYFLSSRNPTDVYSRSFNLDNFNVLHLYLRNSIDTLSDISNIHIMKMSLIQALFLPFWQKVVNTSPFVQKSTSLYVFKFIIILGEYSSTGQNLSCSKYNEEINCSFSSFMKDVLSSDLKKLLNSLSINMIWVNTKKHFRISCIFKNISKTISFFDFFPAESDFFSPCFYVLKFKFDHRPLDDAPYISKCVSDTKIDCIPFFDPSFWNCKILSPVLNSSKLPYDMCQNILRIITKSIGVIIDFTNQFKSFYIFGTFQLSLSMILMYFNVENSFFITHASKIKSISFHCNNFLVLMNNFDGFNCLAFLRYFSCSWAYCCILSCKCALVDTIYLSQANLSLKNNFPNEFSTAVRCSLFTLTPFFIFLTHHNNFCFFIPENKNNIDSIEYGLINCFIIPLSQRYIFERPLFYLEFSPINQKCRRKQLSVSRNEDSELYDNLSFCDRIFSSCLQLTSLIKGRDISSEFIRKCYFILNQLFLEDDEKNETCWLLHNYLLSQHILLSPQHFKVYSQTTIFLSSSIERQIILRFLLYPIFSTKSHFISTPREFILDSILLMRSLIKIQNPEYVANFFNLTLNRYCHPSNGIYYEFLREIYMSLGHKIPKNLLNLDNVSQNSNDYFTNFSPETSSPEKPDYYSNAFNGEASTGVISILNNLHTEGHKEIPNLLRKPLIGRKLSNSFEICLRGVKKRKNVVFDSHRCHKKAKVLCDETPLKMQCPDRLLKIVKLSQNGNGVISPQDFSVDESPQKNFYSESFPSFRNHDDSGFLITEDDDTKTSMSAFHSPLHVFKSSLIRKFK